jgi:hypothetical protein
LSAFGLNKKRWLGIFLATVVFWNSSASLLHAQAVIDLRIIPLEEETRGQATRNVKAMVQDISRGPLAGVEVTFTVPEGKASGTFSNGLKTITVMTDREGVATAQLKPGDTNARVRVKVDARYMEQVATREMLSGGISSAGGGSRKWTYILAGVGGGVLAAALAAGKKGNGTPQNVRITIIPGSPTVGGPQ